MHIRNLIRKFELSFVIKDEWHLPLHKHTHYEIQFIIRGKGEHVVNNERYNYQQGDLFILSPQDSHCFIFKERTAICIVKFHEGFFEDFKDDTNFKQLLYRCATPNRKIDLNSTGRQQTISLMELIIAEHRKASSFQNFIIKTALALLLALVAKHNETGMVKAEGDKSQKILNYIDQNIKEKKLLSVANISEHFNISKHYFNQYFTKATGISYKKYIQQYALNLIARHLVQGNKTLSELAYEYGYSDESHLSNAFKTHFGQTPAVFRRLKTVS